MHVNLLLGWQTKEGNNKSKAKKAAKTLHSTQIVGAAAAAAAAADKGSFDTAIKECGRGRVGAAVRRCRRDGGTLCLMTETIDGK